MELGGRILLGIVEFMASQSGWLSPSEVRLGAAPENGASCAGQVSAREWTPPGFFSQAPPTGQEWAALEQEIGHRRHLSALQSLFGSFLVTSHSSGVTSGASSVRPGTMGTAHTGFPACRSPQGQCTPPRPPRETQSELASGPFLGPLDLGA